MFKKIFDNKKPQDGTKYELLSTTSSYYYPYSGNMMDSDIVRSCIRPIATAVGKLSAKHIRSGKINPQPYIRTLLERPNPYMSMQDMLSKLTYHLELTHNAFAYVKRDAMGYPVEIYPIPYSAVELLEISGEVIVKFRFWTGKYMTIPYTDLIHLRKDFNKSDFYGDDGNISLKNVMEVVTTVDQGIVNAIKNSAILKWLLKFKGVLKPEDVKLQVEEFTKNYLSIDNKGGAAASDPRYDLEQVKSETFLPNGLLFKEAKERIYSYFGVNEAIIQNKYTEDQWNAFYSSIIEPIAIQLSDAFTYVLFTQTERNFGNKIMFSSNRLTFASNTTKTNMARDLIPLGLFTVNEMREIFELEPVEGGDIRMQTLNIVNADKAGEYQGVGGNGNDAENDGDEEGQGSQGSAIDGAVS